MNKIKVLAEASPAVNSSKSGVGYYTKGLLEALTRQNNTKIVFYCYYFNFLGRADKAPRLPKKLDKTEIRITPGKIIPIFKKIGHQPFIEIFIRKKYDFNVFTNYVALPSARKTPYALAIYDVGFIDCPEYVQEKNLRYLEKFCPKSINNAALIITISEFTKNRLIELFPNTKNKIVITPIPPLARTSAKHSGLEIQKVLPDKYILFVGTIEPRKNITNLVEAYTMLPKDIKKAYGLVLAGGNGWKNEEIIQSIKNAQVAGENIVQTGYISDAEKDYLYSNASLFVLPSHYEGFGMPILEAMQYDIPCAISDIEVFHEVAGNAAVYFDKDSPASVADSMSNVLEDKILAKDLAHKGRENLKKFSWENNAKLVIDSIQKTLTDRVER